VNKDLTTKIEVHLQILIAESWEKWELTTEANIDCRIMGKMGVDNRSMDLTERQT
jgi:hypothetical protein